MRLRHSVAGVLKINIKTLDNAYLIIVYLQPLKVEAQKLPTANF